MQIPWSQVEAIAIRTTADGPFAEDVFWQLLVDGRLIEIPGAMVGKTFFDEMYERLPGVDTGRIVRAMGSMEERTFYVWPTGGGELEPRFAALVARLGGTVTAAAFACVHGAWSEPHRRYHSLEHLRDCLRELDDVESPERDEIELALWYHDAVYKPGARDNEEQSARLLLSACADLAVPRQIAGRAAELVRMTTHQFPPRSAGEAVLLDIDLSILGRDALRFMDYEYGIAEEYAHVSAFEFRVARGRFLASLLARPHMFHTRALRSRYEARARVQLGALLRSPRYRAYRWLRWLP